ncbi:F-box/kelch-repeat protein [Acorus calamus]|uniref:F-box/kelch-repeat protein n=1 Tax=Acorus calamus TaxID=4465 RepID=A0AAV9D2R0_ACOCL|nr:F-box/kelch-repeat protein [Acorus calamus]
MAVTCHSRSFTWLVKSCLPNPSPDHHHRRLRRCPPPPPPPPSLATLPDDLLMDCLSRVPPSSLPSLSLVSRRFSLLLSSPSFLHLRRRLGHLRPSLHALSLSADLSLLSSASHPLLPSLPWTLHPPIPLPDSVGPHRLVSLGHVIYAIGRSSTVRYDTWTRSASISPGPIHPRKRFAAAEVDGKIYVAGGSARSSAVEEFDPETDTWRAVSECPRRRYGCVGAASSGGVFYVIGGLKIGRSEDPSRRAHVYASTIDAYDVRGRVWLRSRGVPGGGCVVGACGVGSHVYILCSHAVEMSFWRWDGGRAWERLGGPPIAGQVGMDGSARFACVGFGDRTVVIVVVQAGSSRGGGVSLVYDCEGDEWARGPDLPEVLGRVGCVCVEAWGTGGT